MLYTGITTYPTGTYTPCCFVQYKNAYKGPIKEYWNSDFLNNMKKSFDNNEWPEACRRCRLTEESGADSKRINEWNKHYKKHKSFNVEPGKLDVIDLRLSNLCNQACVFCNSVNSSKIEDELKIHGEAHVDNVYYNHQPFANVDFRNPFTKEEIFSLFDNISDNCRVYITGGEPSILKINYEVLEYLIDNKLNEKVWIDLNTNFQVWNDKFYDLLKHFPGRMMASIDATGKQLEYIRHHSDWNNVSANFLRFRDEFPNWEVKVSPAAFMLNAWAQIDLIEWSLENKLPINFFNILINPGWLDVRLLPKKTKNDVIKQLEKYKKLPYSNIDNYMKFISSERTDFTLKDTAFNLDKIDAIRGNNWRETFPELADIVRKQQKKGLI